MGSIGYFRWILEVKDSMGFETGGEAEGEAEGLVASLDKCNRMCAKVMYWKHIYGHGYGKVM